MDKLREEGKPGTAVGVHGDPRRLTAALGQLGVELIVSQTVEAIRKETAGP